MRDVERISEVLLTLEHVWRRFPDLRLGQLVCNAAPVPDPYNVEDDVLLEGLKQYGYG